ENLLVLGIGGSDLGTRAILEALPHKKRVVFAGDNMDPVELNRVLCKLDLKKTAVNVVSKSGNTLETLASFMIVREKLKRIVGKNFAQQIIATTDQESGTLSEWARFEKYHQLIIPENVGGRFSVLSDVGLFPAGWAGISIQKLLAGAAGQMAQFSSRKPEDQIPAMLAALYASLHQETHRNIFVLMPYAAELQAFARWYRQLFAESLGKKENRSGLRVPVGFTPLATIGPRDQHSQIQLYMEGPRDKVITFVEIQHWDEDYVIPDGPLPSADLFGLSGRRMSDVQKAERRATAEALAANQSPNGTLFLKQLDAESLGELFQFFMLTTAYLGEFLDVNAYDQPGVEEGKRRLRAWLRST
ncbi:MAG TPA: glucose-6-phosphate isomerase, partial [Patescibacteria group bacterium]|nr:glucose-6-phosphate isomerase [Patescibacteria group bacterium]